LNTNRNTLQAHFISEDLKNKLTFVVSDSSAYHEVWSLFQNKERLESYVLLEGSENPIYLPENPLEMRTQTFAVKKIDSSLLLPALFANKDDVKSNFNFNERYYTDGQRGMRISDEGHLMEFINPIHLK